MQPATQQLFDAIGVSQKSWQPPIAAALARLLARSSPDRYVLHSTTGLLERAAPDLPNVSSLTRASLRARGLGIEDDVLLAFNGLASLGHLNAGHLTLAQLMLELQLRNRQDARILALASVINGGLTMKSEASRGLGNLLDGVTSCCGLLEKFDGIDPKEPAPHKSFARLWNDDGLSSTLRVLCIEGAQRKARLDISLAPKLGGYDPNALEVSLAPKGCGDPENYPSAPSDTTSAAPLEQGPAATEYVFAEARALGLIRRSRLEITAAPDQLLPAGMGSVLVAKAIIAAEGALATRDIAAAERHAALVLMIATGAAEIEIPHISMGTTVTKDAPYSVDLDQAALFRFETREETQLEKTLVAGSWLPTGGPLAQPLPLPLVDLLRRVRRATTKTDSGWLFPLTRSRAEKEPLPAWRLEIAKLYPELHITPTVFRARIAAHVSETIGPDGAQLLFGDGFALSPAATHYSRISAASLAKASWRSVAPFFGEDPDRLATGFVLPSHFVGSRIAPAQAAIHGYASAIKKQVRATAARLTSDLREAWGAHVDQLAAEVAAVTGHRPTNALGEVTLYDFVPEWHLATLSDKEVDPAHLVRVAGTGDRVLATLASYLQFLVRCQQQERDPQASALASRILWGASPLLAMPGDAGEVRYSAQRLTARMPRELSQAPNALRHRLYQQLQNEDLSPELRHAQMGWLITDAHAHSDLSPVSAVEIAAALKVPIDRHVIADGWMGETKRDTPWTWDRIPLPALMDWSMREQEHRQSHAAATQRLVAAYRETKDACLVQLRPRLIKAFSLHCPTLELDSVKHMLVSRDKTKTPTPTEIGIEKAELILQAAIEGLDSVAVPYVARAELARLIKRAHRDELVTGFIPSYQIPNFHSVPSPFLRGSGLAVRHIFLLRSLVADCLASPEKQTPKSVGCAAMLGLLCFSPYRSLESVRQMLGSEGAPLRGNSEKSFIRVTTGTGSAARQFVLSGEAALVYLRYWQFDGKTSLPTDAELGRWLQERLPDLCGSIQEPKQIAACV